MLLHCCTSPGSAKKLLCHHMSSGVQEKAQFYFMGTKCVCWRLTRKKC